MKILLLTDGITPYVTGGMQKHSAMLSKLFTFEGHMVTLMYCVMSTASIPKKTEVNYSIFNSSTHKLHSILGFQFPSLPKIPGHYVRASKIYSRLLLDNIVSDLENFDFIYAQGFTGHAFINYKNQGNRIPPIFSNLHGLEMFQYAASLKVKLQHYLLRPLACQISLGSDFNYSFGGQLKSTLKSIGVKKEQILECSHGITSDWIYEKAPPKANRILNFVFIGRYERRKGIEELNEVLSEITPTTPFQFHFIGDIPKEKRIADSQIIYHGKISDYAKMKEILNQTDVLVCPSYAEGMPTVIFEAMALGNAIIATDVGAVNQQVSSANGWLLSSPKPSLIKEALKEAVYLPKDKLHIKKQNSLTLVRTEFTWEKVIKKKLRLAEHAITSS
ncbi:MAG: glycosyltransferase family 4 protein [Saprospiraceae bacterium]